MLSAYTGTSDGGMAAQVYVQKYPGETGGLVLISTGGLDANTIKSLKRQYFFAPLARWYPLQRQNCKIIMLHNSILQF